jgi:TPR repeat protein
VSKDEEMAIQWYKKSASAGNVFALHSLGYCYQFGFGTEIDLKKV